MLQIEKLYMQYGQDVYRYLLSLTRDPLLSEDLLSETFLGSNSFAVMAEREKVERFPMNSSKTSWQTGICQRILPSI